MPTEDKSGATLHEVALFLAETGGEIWALNPNLHAGQPDGASTPQGRHFSWRVWNDLADELNCSLRVLQLQDTRAKLQFVPRPPQTDWKKNYGPESEFSAHDKLSDPSTLFALLEALGRASPPEGARVLVLGLGMGPEIAALELAFPERRFDIVGVDLSPETVARARERWPDQHFVCGDALALLPELGRFDLVFSLGFLCCVNVQAQPLLQALRRHNLHAASAMIWGLPNAKLNGGELSFGSRMRNFARPDLSHVLSDAAIVRRFCHKHGHKVFVTGKHEIILTALPAGVATGELKRNYPFVETSSGVTS